MANLYRCPTCDGNGFIDDIEEGLPYCYTCSGMVPERPAHDNCCPERPECHGHKDRRPFHAVDCHCG